MMDIKRFLLTYLFIVLIYLSIAVLFYGIAFMVSKLYWRVSLLFAWYDCWRGLFYDIKKKILYIFPVPMIGVKIQLQSNKGENKSKR